VRLVITLGNSTGKVVLKPAASVLPMASPVTLRTVLYVQSTVAGAHHSLACNPWIMQFQANHALLSRHCVSSLSQPHIPVLKATSGGLLFHRSATAPPSSAADRLKRRPGIYYEEIGEQRAQKIVGRTANIHRSGNKPRSAWSGVKTQSQAGTTASQQHQLKIVDR